MLFRSIGPYIGLYQVPGSPEPAGGWVWEDGTSSTGYTNWFFNQPDNYNGDNVGAFYNGFDMASADTPWGVIYDGLTILTGPGSPGPNPFLANSFVVSSPAATPFMTSMVMSRFMMADTSSDLPADFLPSLTFQSQPEVPGPLPVIGGLLAYHRSRQLRARMGRLRSTTSR